jgi:hypothetical protein
MKNETRAMLETFFEPYNSNRELYDLLGSDWKEGVWDPSS